MDPPANYPGGSILHMGGMHSGAHIIYIGGLEIFCNKFSASGECKFGLKP